jgi:hypothetical protein
MALLYACGGRLSVNDPFSAQIISARADQTEKIHRREIYAGYLSDMRAYEMTTVRAPRGSCC